MTEAGDGTGAPEFFTQVLETRNLSKAGELFHLSDEKVMVALPYMVPRIIEVINSENYASSSNDQSVVEICIQRISTALRQTENIEQQTDALVSILDACHGHSLCYIKPNEDSPHAKIASDVMSCLFTKYQNEEVMKHTIPVVVKFLNCDNGDLERSVSSYLSLAAIDKVHLLSEHTSSILDSILKGNHLLVQVMPQIYPQASAPVDEKIDELITLMAGHKEAVEKCYYLQLFAAVAKRNPKLLEKHLPLLFRQLDSGLLAPSVVAMFVDMAHALPQAFLPHRGPLVELLDSQPALATLTAQVLGSLGLLSESEARLTMDQLLTRLETLEKSHQPMVLQEVRGLGLKFPTVRSEFLDRVTALVNSGSTAVRILAQQIQEDHQKYNGEKEMKSVSSQTEGTVTIITVGNPPNATHPSGTVSVKMTAVPPTTLDSSQLSLAKSSRTSSTARLASERAGSPTSTLHSEQTSLASTAVPHGISNESMRDGVQHFCEKHLATIKSFVNNISARMPLPARCSVVNGKHRRYVKLHLGCAHHGAQCLFSKDFFTLDTRLPRPWLHLMFLAVQAQSTSALSQHDSKVSVLKACWDALKGERGSSFLTLVTSSFPSPKDQDSLLQELHEVRYFDVFEFNAARKFWACFMCNHPEKVSGLLQDGLPVIAGQLKEKKGKWKFLKRWKTRYFTLSGGQFTYSKSDSLKEILPVSQIRSVKAVRKGIRDIPRAFEIFTADQTYVFKAKGQQDVEQWVHCLHIAVARMHRPASEVASEAAGGASSGLQPGSATQSPLHQPVMTDTKL